MAKFKLEAPFTEVHGLLSKEQSIVTRSHFGKQIMYRMEPFRGTASEKQGNMRKAFGQFSIQARQELQDPDLKAYWVKRFQQQDKYKRLDCYVAAQLRLEAQHED